MAHLHPYDAFLRMLNLKTYKELYTKLESMIEEVPGMDKLPFTLCHLEHPPGNKGMPEVTQLMFKIIRLAGRNYSRQDAIDLIKFLKENPPKESYEKPKLPDIEATPDEKNLMRHIFEYGIDLPGSEDNLYGHLQYYSSFFIDMFFGNYTEFIAHIKSLSKKELKKALKKREGYCQFSPLFAPILGLRMAALDNMPDITQEQYKKIRLLYSGNNENRHLDILKKIVDLRADINATDINGYTPLQHAVRYRNVGMVRVLLQYGADPNTESRTDYRPLSSLSLTRVPNGIAMIGLLIEANGKLTDKDMANELRSTAETYCTKDIAVKVREAHPRENEECEKCVQPAEKKCKACNLVFYCSLACQKLDWNFHKVTCQKNRNEVN